MLFPRLFRNVTPGPVEQLKVRNVEIQTHDSHRFEYVSAKDAGL
jgi:hypothetical protein